MTATAWLQISMKHCGNDELPFTPNKKTIGLVQMCNDLLRRRHGGRDHNCQDKPFEETIIINNINV